MSRIATFALQTRPGVYKEEVEELLQKFEEKINEKLRKLTDHDGEGLQLTSPVERDVMQAKAMMKYKKRKCSDESCKQFGGATKKSKIDEEKEYTPRLVTPLKAYSLQAKALLEYRKKQKQKGRSYKQFGGATNNIKDSFI